MKKDLTIKLGALTSIALLAAFAPACTGESDPTTGDEQDATSSVDDVFAKTVLAGGCSVKLEKTGKTVKTTGKGGTCPKTVTGVLDVIKQNAKNKTHVYVVSEQGDQTGKDLPYRFVIAVETEKGPADKLFLSVLGSGADGVSDTFMEVMSFSEKKGVYAFYDLGDSGWVQEGDGTQVPTAALGAEPPFRCIGCHTTGTPLMKELHDSWQNWSSTWFTMPAPETSQELMKGLFAQVERADDLEDHIVAGTKARTKARVDKGVKEKKLKPLFTQLLCDVGEPSLIGAHSKNSQRVGTVSTFSSMVPTAILVNQFLKRPATGTGTEEGFTGLELAIPSLSSVRIDSTSYVKALGTIGQKIAGKTGDAMFPMSSPEKSYADFIVTEELLARNLIDKDVIADTLMVDFTVSTFSKTRCALADTLPDTWTSADELKTKWAANLSASKLRGAKGLAARLEDKADTDKHAATVDKFVSACNARGAADKDAWALDLLKIVSQRRAEFLDHYEQVVESDWLIPTDNLKSVPFKIRLNGETCTIEDQSKPFVGE
ncbi:MAG TPA: hypothetical protein VL400_15120 [Polyangiaceae bacterium]|nr:hypothetical protein [Polyangiaceae bacterium]